MLPKIGLFSIDRFRIVYQRTVWLYKYLFFFQTFGNNKLRCQGPDDRSFNRAIWQSLRDEEKPLTTNSENQLISYSISDKVSSVPIYTRSYK